MSEDIKYCPVAKEFCHDGTGKGVTCQFWYAERIMSGGAVGEYRCGLMGLVEMTIAKAFKRK